MKRLIVCCDGTWQKLTSEYPTNVVKMAQAIKTVDHNGISQVVHYSEGIGTGDLVDRLGGGAFGWGIDNVIQNAYRFLCLNYVAGDEIYLFGFSRGAYIVRSLAGFIYNVGLLNRPYIRNTPGAYALYRNRSEETHPDSEEARTFRQQYSQEVKITFLGCWDTVGSLGIPDQIPYFPLDNLVNRKYQFHDTRINQSIQCARHAVAVDEERKVFYVTPMHKSRSVAQQDLKQIWFPGDHSCVGGGTKAHRQLSDGVLQWMMNEAEQQGLSFEQACIEGGIEIDPTIPFDNTPTGLFAGLGMKIRRLKDDPRSENLEHSAEPERLDQLGFVYATFDDLHSSVQDRWMRVPTYRPEGLEVFSDRLSGAPAPARI